MTTEDLKYYLEQIYRVILESLEVSFVICKTELKEYTIAKVFDLLSQILPTGFVLHTGFWPFFNSNKKQCICICGRYGLDCRHSIHGRHWLDMESICNDTSMIFSSSIGDLVIVNYHIDLTPQSVGGLSYGLSIKLTMRYNIDHTQVTRRKRNQTIVSTKFDPHQPFTLYIKCRCSLQKQYFPNWRSIMFQPSPFYHVSYGSVFHDLLISRQPYVAFLPDRSNSYYTVPTETMPPFTLFLQDANLPTYHYPQYIHATLTTPQTEPVVNNSRTTQRNLALTYPSYTANNNGYQPTFDNSYYSYYNNLEDTTNNNNQMRPQLLALEYNITSITAPAPTQASTEWKPTPRRRTKKGEVSTTMTSNNNVSGVMGSSNNVSRYTPTSQPPPVQLESFNTAFSTMAVNQLDNDFMDFNLDRMPLRPLEEQLKKDIELEFYMKQQQQSLGEDTSQPQNGNLMRYNSTG